MITTHGAPAPVVAHPCDVTAVTGSPSRLHHEHCGSKRKASGKVREVGHHRRKASGKVREVGHHRASGRHWGGGNEPRQRHSSAARVARCSPVAGGGPYSSGEERGK
jgi:hypothetical protein